MLPMCMNFAENYYMNTYGIIIFSIVMLHLLVGFGYMIYKLSSKGKS